MRYLLIAIAIFCAACGYKTDPKPKDTLGIPRPTEVAITLNEGGMLIKNSMELPVFVERMIPEQEGVLDETLRPYRALVMIPPNGEYIDTNITQGVRYRYRLSSYLEQYNAYSESITHTISYTGRVAFEDVDLSVLDDTVCITFNQTAYVTSYELLINGVKQTLRPNNCYQLPNQPNVLVVMVPYAESGLPGVAYSESILRDEKNMFMPPYQVRILRRENAVTLSWDAVTNAARYRIVADSDNGGMRRVFETDTTIYTIPAPAEEGCVAIGLYSISGNGAVSEPNEMVSCE